MNHTPIDKALERTDKDAVRDRKEDDSRVGRMVQGPGGEGDEFPDFTAEARPLTERRRKPGTPPPLPGGRR